MPKRLVGICAAVVVALGLAGCGGDHGGGAHDGPAATGQAAVVAFLAGMVPHHESAIEMAALARERAESPAVRRVAQDITGSQTAEIAQMRRIHRRLVGSELVPDEGAHARLGLSADEAGMDHGDAAAELEDAEPFDPAFAEEMIGHHRGAIAMARAVLPETDDPELRRLARSIIAEQTREIRILGRV